MRGKQPDQDWRPRFWAKVDRRGPNDCWPWTGAISKNGYGSFKLNRVALTTSRVAWEAATGVSAGKNMVLHKCDNRPCCNPSHLYLGDVRQNSRDMVERGRGRNGVVIGSSNPRAKLNEADIVRIRGMIADGQLNTVIAAKFGVSHQMISKIRQGHFWKHVPMGKGEAA